MDTKFQYDVAVTQARRACKKRLRQAVQDGFTRQVYISEKSVAASHAYKEHTELWSEDSIANWVDGSTDLFCVNCRDRCGAGTAAVYKTPPSTMWVEKWECLTGSSIKHEDVELVTIVLALEMALEEHARRQLEKQVTLKVNTGETLPARASDISSAGRD